MLTVLLPIVLLSAVKSVSSCTWDSDCFPSYDYCWAHSCYRYRNHVPYYGIGGGLFGIFLIALIWFLVRRQRINQQLQNARNVNMALAMGGQPNVVYTVNPQVIMQPAPPSMHCDGPPPMHYQDPPPKYPTGGYVQM